MNVTIKKEKYVVKLHNRLRESQWPKNDEWIYDDAFDWSGKVVAVHTCRHRYSVCPYQNFSVVVTAMIVFS